MKVLLDMNLSADWLPLLAEASIEAKHWSSVGHATAQDAAIMGYAIQHDYVVLTHDLDFGILLAQRRMRKPKRCPDSHAGRISVCNRNSGRGGAATDAASP